MKLLEQEDRGRKQLFVTMTKQETLLLIESLGAQLAGTHGGGIINQPFWIRDNGGNGTAVYIVQGLEE